MELKIGYCKDCQYCIIVNQAKDYGLCMKFNEGITHVEYHSCTEYREEKKKKEGELNA